MTPATSLPVMPGYAVFRAGLADDVTRKHSAFSAKWKAGFRYPPLSQLYWKSEPPSRELSGSVSAVVFDETPTRANSALELRVEIDGNGFQFGCNKPNLLNCDPLESIIDGKSRQRCRIVRKSSHRIVQMITNSRQWPHPDRMRIGNETKKEAL